MKKPVFILIFAMLIGCSINSSAQVITKYGDNVSTLDGIIKAYYDVVTVKKRRHGIL